MSGLGNDEIIYLTSTWKISKFLFVCLYVYLFVSLFKTDFLKFRR